MKRIIRIKKKNPSMDFSKPGICSFTGVEEMAAVCFKFYGSSEKKVSLECLHLQALLRRGSSMHSRCQRSQQCSDSKALQWKIALRILCHFVEQLYLHLKCFVSGDFLPRNIHQLENCHC